MRELSLDQLRTLVTIVDLGTFSAAANALHLAQPTISLHISDLESRLGGALLMRGSRRVQATALGALVIDRARRLLRDTDDMLEAARKHVEGKVGRVRLGTSTGVVVNLLPRVLRQLESSFPGIDVEVNILGSNDTMARLQEGTLDIGLVSTPIQKSKDILITHWRSDRMMAFLPASWKSPASIRPAWLVDKPMIFNDATTQMYRLTMAWFAAAGENPRARIELNYNEAMKSLVSAGYGAAILPLEQPLAAELERHKGIRIVPLSPVLKRHIGVAHRALPGLDKATINVLETIRQFNQT